MKVNSQVEGSKFTKDLSLLQNPRQCPPLTCPSFAEVVTSVDPSDGVVTKGSNVDLTCTVESSATITIDTADICKWTKDGSPMASDSQFRFGNLSCGNFQFI